VLAGSTLNERARVEQSCGPTNWISASADPAAAVDLTVLATGLNYNTVAPSNALSLSGKQAETLVITAKRNKYFIYFMILKISILDFV
jgi:hypothetical protein